MKLLNLSQTSGYTHQLITDPKNKIIQFVHNEPIELGDNLKIILNGSWRAFEIIEIIESRKAKGQHKDKNATWFNTSVNEIVFVL